MFAPFLAFLVAAPAFGAAPKAALKASPASVPSGGLVRFDTTGTVSDPGCKLYLVDGPDFGEQLFRADGKLAAYCLTKPGYYTFVLVAYGTGSPDSAPAQVLVTPSAIVPAPPAVTPPVISKPPIIFKPPVQPPVNPPASDALSAATRAYIGGSAQGFRQVANQVQVGYFTSVGDVITAVGASRKAAGATLAAEMDRRMAAASDPTGRITDAAAVAAALNAVADVMEAMAK